MFAAKLDGRDLAAEKKDSRRRMVADRVDDLLEAFIALRKDEKFVDWQLVIAGDGSPKYEDSLKQIIRENNASDSVLLTGWLDGEAKSRALAGASVMALPSHHDAFGLCVIEAMAHGIPVLVGTQVGLAKEILIGGAGWTSEVEISALSETLALILSDHDERRRRGMAGRALASKFDWQHVAEMLVRLYESIQPWRRPNTRTGEISVSEAQRSTAATGQARGA